MLVSGSDGRPAGVSIHAPLRGATWTWSLHPRLGSGFNPRTPAGCDVGLGLEVEFEIEVSIHAPLRGATQDYFDSMGHRDVSIHAPLRGATLNHFAFNEILINVSIHAPLRGATNPKVRVAGGNVCFNPRTPAGCDLIDRWYDNYIVVSIHAPLRGATKAVKRGHIRHNGFNPRTPAGCDAECSFMRNSLKAFQSTHPCGVRPGSR